MAPLPCPAQQSVIATQHHQRNPGETIYIQTNIYVYILDGPRAAYTSIQRLKASVLYTRIYLQGVPYISRRDIPSAEGGLRGGTVQRNHKKNYFSI